MRPEDKEDDYIEDKENEEIEDINSDTQDNETTEEEANTHSDYKVPGKGDTRVTTYHLSGMYQNWFLDYASYVILERAVPHINDGLKPVQRLHVRLSDKESDSLFHQSAAKPARQSHSV